MQDFSTPENATRMLVEALRKGDGATFTKGVYGGKSGAVIAELTKTPDFPSPTVEKIAVTEQGETMAKVEVTLRFAKPISVNNKSSKNLTETLTLRKVGTGWQLVAPKPSDFSPNTAGLVQALAFFVAHPEVMEASRKRARTAASMSNLRQIALAAVMFVQDHDDKFTFPPADYRKALQVYTKNVSLFTSPYDKPGTQSYKFNTALYKKSLSVVKNPSRTVMFYEGAPGKLLFRNDGKALIAFADGHVMLITPAEAKKLRWEP
jgi:prepilin-type processing-associated H-X9-DG protein